MEAHADERLAQTEELTTEYDDQISGVTALLRAPACQMQLIRMTKAHLLLLLRGHDQHLGGRVHDVHLFHDGGSVASHEQLVVLSDDHLVHACAPVSQAPQDTAPAVIEGA